MLDIKPARVVVKALTIFAALNLAFAMIQPPIERLSFYSVVVPRRLRFPIESYPVVADNLPSLFAAHVVSDPPRTAGEYRVFLLGDSQTWGIGLTTPQTLAQQFNSANLSACGRSLRFYNLALPYASVLRDFFTLNASLRYKPDLIVWMLTANSFAPAPWPLNLINGDPSPLLALLQRYSLERYETYVGSSPTFLDRTLVGQRTRLRRLALLQMNALEWDAFGIDTGEFHWPSPPPLETSVGGGTDWRGLQPPNLDTSQLMFDVLPRVRQSIGKVPVLVVNEPMFIAPGANSDIRYNSFYPRWAYDQYLPLVKAAVHRQGWRYEDLHSLVSYKDFTDVMHLTPGGVTQMEHALEPDILAMACP